MGFQGLRIVGRPGRAGPGDAHKRRLFAAMRFRTETLCLWPFAPGLHDGGRCSVLCQALDDAPPTFLSLKGRRPALHGRGIAGAEKPPIRLMLQRQAAIPTHGRSRHCWSKPTKAAQRLLRASRGASATSSPTSQVSMAESVGQAGQGGHVGAGITRCTLGAHLVGRFRKFQGMDRSRARAETAVRRASCSSLRETGSARRRKNCGARNAADLCRPGPAQLQPAMACAASDHGVRAPAPALGPGLRW